MPDPIPWTSAMQFEFDAWKRRAWSDFYEKHGERASEADFTPLVDAARARFDRKLFARRFDASGAAVASDDRLAILDGKLGSTAALEAVRGWFAQCDRGAHNPRFLVLLGSVGIGKTVAAAWALHELGGAYVVANMLHGRLHPPRGAERPAASLLDERLVVLDDIGTEMHDRFRGALFELVNARQRAGLLTILTGNVTLAELAEQCDPRVRSRLNHCGVMLELGGGSLRMAGGM